MASWTMPSDSASKAEVACPCGLQMRKPLIFAAPYAHSRRPRPVKSESKGRELEKKPKKGLKSLFRSAFFSSKSPASHMHTTVPSSSSSGLTCTSSCGKQQYLAVSPQGLCNCTFL